MKNETSHRVYQTSRQLGTNMHAGVANTVRARLGTTMNLKPMSEETSREGLRDGFGAAVMLEAEEEDLERLTMTSVDDEVVATRMAWKTTKVAKLWPERMTQLQLHVDAAARSPPAMQ
uniref:Uncharacterized protein n=1 Tax=Oryza meridionalis TaxID=40149 RepID=A0A0E0FAW3_9ORYZ